MALLKRTIAKSLAYGDTILVNGERLMVEHIEEEVFGRNIEFKKEFGGQVQLFMPNDQTVTIEL